MTITAEVENPAPLVARTILTKLFLDTEYDVGYLTLPFVIHEWRKWSGLLESC